MIIHNPILTGSFTFNGTDVSSVTGSSTFSASFASSINSLNAATASLNSFSASVNTFTASAATTGSNTFVGNQVITGSLNVSGSITTPGTLTAQTLVVQTITSSVDFVTGSTRFGSLLANTHTFTGSILATGSLTLNGAVANYDLNIYNTIPRIQLQNPTTGTTTGDGFHLYQNGGDTYIINKETSSLFLGANNVVAMTITGSNVGIGTSSPSVALHIANGSATTVGLFEYTGGTNSYVGIKSTSGTNYIGNVGYDMTFEAGGSEKVRILSGGNVGIGITNPSYKFEVRSSSTTDENIANFQSAINALNRYALVRIGQPSYAAYIGVNLNTYDTAYFSTNANPTSGLGIYYSTANRLGINVKQPTNELTLVASSTTTGKGIDFVNYASPSQVIGQLTFEQVGDFIELKHKIAGGGIKFSTYDTERMRITSGGNIGIGTTTPVTLNGADVNVTIYSGQDCSLTLKDAVDSWEFYMNDDLYITTGSYNSAALTLLRSTGRVGIGTISPYSPLHVNGAAAFNGTITNFGTGTDTYTQSTWYLDTSNQILFEHGRTTNAASGTGRTVYFTWRGGPSVGGGVQLQHGANAWASYTSDARLKTKVADVENGLEAVMKLNPIKFKWTRELENSRTVTGFTAQNIGEAIPDAVFNSWQDEELGDVKSYYQDYLIPYLVKAIQELKAEFDEYKATHP